MHAPSPEPVRRLHALVLDGQYCHALASVRSLGRRDIVVTVASHKERAQGFASRYCTKTLRCPSPVTEPAPYTEWLLDTLRRGRYDATLCFEEATADILSQHRERVQSLTGCPMPPREVFLAASRKDRVMRFARQLGVPTPQTYELAALSDAATLAAQLPFPVIVKGVHSSGSQQVELVRKAADFLPTVERLAGLRRDPSLALPIVQEYIPGHGYGLTALMRRGEPVAAFMHRRTGEHDIAHGVQLAHGAGGAVSVHEPELLSSGLALLQALCWDGVAMVEFRRSARDGKFYLVEINPRFVGSLELAIAAGIDLPWLYVQLASGRPLAGPNRYRVGLRYRWLLSKNIADVFENPFGYVFGALSALLPGTKCDLSLRDPRPHWYQLRNAAWFVRDYLWKKRTATAITPQPASPDALPVAAPAEPQCPAAVSHR